MASVSSRAKSSFFGSTFIRTDMLRGFTRPM
jgi:hypothetical protein